MEHKESLAEIIDQLVEFLREEDQINQAEIAKAIGLGNGANLHHARKSLNRKKFNGMSRKEVIQEICHQYGLKVDVDAFGKVKVHRKPQKPGSNGGSHGKPLSISNFYYFYDESEVNQFGKINWAKLIVKEYSDTTKATLTLYKANGDERATYEGQIISKNNSSETIFNFERIEKGENLPPSVYSLLVLNTSADGFRSNIIYGTYAAIDASGPVCGKAILVSYEEATEELATETPSINPIIYEKLLSQRISADESPANGWDEDLVNNLVSASDSVSGVYIGYAFSSTDKQFIKFRLRFNDDGTTRYKSPATSEYKGNFRIIYRDPSLIVANYDYRGDLDMSRIQIILKLPKEGETKLFGIYSGFDGENRPMAGKCLLIEEPTTAYEDIQIDFIKNIHKTEYPNVELIYSYFLGGKSAPPYEDIHLDILNILRPMTYLKEKEIFQTSYYQSRMKDLAGTYRSYKLSSDRQRINSNVLKIDPNGVFEMKDHTGNSKYFRGRVYIIERSILCFDVEKRGDDIYGGLFLFYVGNKSRREFRHLHGASVLITNNPSIRCGREVLMPVGEVFKTAESNVISLPWAGGVNQAFNDLNKEYPELVKFLSGRNDNLIKPDRDPDKAFERKENYGHLYFSSACYYALLFLQNSDDRASLNRFMENFDVALEHGFGLIQEDYQWFASEMEPGRIIARLPDEIKAETKLKMDRIQESVN